MTHANHCPVVACSPSSHRQASLYHHRWLVVDEEGRLITAQSCPALADVTTDIKLGYLVLRAPGMLRMDIPLDVIEDDDSVLRQALVGEQQVQVVDEGDLAAVWFGHVTGRVSRLVKVHPDAAQIDW
jgi:uncharacterized protein YcbX